MQGVGDPQGGFFSRLPGHPLLAGLPFDFKNCGIGGNTLWDMLGRAGMLSTSKPYRLIVILGCNDLPRSPDTSPEKRSSLAEYKSMAGELLRLVQGEKSLFISSFAVSPQKTGIDPELFENYKNTAIGAAEALGYEIWDLYQESKPGVEKFWAIDGLHFNAQGHAFIADHVADWLKQG